MSATHRVGLLLIVGLAFVLGNAFAGAQGEKAKELAQKWEHKQVGTSKEVEALGSEGWELVAMEPKMTWITQRDIERNSTRSFFPKRPKQ